MAMPGYFIEVTFTDGSVVTTYATVIGEWYYFYSDKRYRFTRGTGTNVLLQQYQPIGTNMAWYDINIIQSVDVQQFDPSTAGGGASPDDAYTKEEVNALIKNAVKQIMSNIDEIVAQKVNEAISSGLGENYYTKQETDNRYVKKAGDTMTGALYIRNGDNYFYCNGKEATLFGESYNVYMNSADGIGLTTTTGKYIMRVSASGFAAYNQGTVVGRLFNNNGKGALAIYDNSKGNNNWIEPEQISCWVNGGTVQRTIIFGNDAVNFNATIQVPSYSSFLVASGTRYGNGIINNYVSELAIEFNDSKKYAFNANGIQLYQIAFYFMLYQSANRISINNGLLEITYNNSSITLNSATGQIKGNGLDLTVAGTNGSRLGDGSSAVSLRNRDWSVELNYLLSLSTTEQYYTVNMITAINSVINNIQNTIGTNYSAVIQPHTFSAGGGSTRGGGVGRGY